MKLTCVTATFNAIAAGNRERLVRCVESVAKLATEHEHLIYDGASTDGTVELLRALEAKTPGLKVVSEKDTGIYNALNKGVRDAQGEWFYVLGCDDYICDPTVFDELIAGLTDADDVLATTVRKQREDGETLMLTALSDLNRIFLGPCACHQGECIRTSIARDLGGFDERYAIAADSNMFLKAHMRGFNFKYVFKVFACFTDGGTAYLRGEEGLREHRTSVADVLGLVGAERQMMIRDLKLPLGMCFRLFNHSDIAIRQSARTMIRTHLKLALRIVLYPLVAVTRSMRHPEVKERRSINER